MIGIMQAMTMSMLSCLTLRLEINWSVKQFTNGELNSIYWCYFLITWSQFINMHWWPRVTLKTYKRKRWSLPRQVNNEQHMCHCIWLGNHSRIMGLCMLKPPGWSWLDNFNPFIIDTIPSTGNKVTILVPRLTLNYDQYIFILFSRFPLK